MLGIIGGTAILNAKLPPLKETDIATPYGTVTVLLSDNVALLKRHQHGNPPHMINHRANIAAMKIVGVDKLILIASVGGMKPEFKVGTLALVSDYFSPWVIPTFHEHNQFHIPPSIDSQLTSGLQELVPDAKTGVYLQTRGPRFETKSEIAHYAHDTDLVGMTAASEITLANELSIPVACLCTVDNPANGVLGAAAPSFDDILAESKKTSERMSILITKIIEKFA